MLRKGIKQEKEDKVCNLALESNKNKEVISFLFNTKIAEHLYFAIKILNLMPVPHIIGLVCKSTHST